jgi:hypothetical protein
MKVKKLLAFLMAATLLVSMFAVTAHASGVTNIEGDWYKYCFYGRDYDNSLDAETAAKVHGVRFHYTLVELDPDDGLSGTVGIESQDNWWDGGKDFDLLNHDPATHRTTITDEIIEYRQRAAFVSPEALVFGDDVSSENAVARVHLAVWSGQLTVNKVEMLDADGNVLIAVDGDFNLLSGGRTAAAAPAEAAPAEAAPADGEAAEAAPAAPAPVAARTGDSSMVALFSLLFAAAAIGLVALRRKQYN